MNNNVVKRLQEWIDDGMVEVKLEEPNIVKFICLDDDGNPCEIYNFEWRGYHTVVSDSEDETSGGGLFSALLDLGENGPPERR